MMLVPVLNFDVEYVPTPDLTVVVASTVEPSRNSTFPVGGFHPEMTSAVKVTDLPETDGFEDEASVVVVESSVTTWEMTFETLLRKFVSPLYVAVIECVAREKFVMLMLATLPLTGEVPIGVEPSLNVTVPVTWPPY